MMDLQDLLHAYAKGASVLMATSYIADELAVEHDVDSVGEHIIATQLLRCEKSMIGEERWWFDTRAFMRMFCDNRKRDMATVVRALDNLDIGVADCLEEGEEERRESGVVYDWVEHMESKQGNTR